MGKGGKTLSSAGWVYLYHVSFVRAIGTHRITLVNGLSGLDLEKKSGSDFPEKPNCYRDFQEDGHVPRKLPGKWTAHLRVHGQPTSASLIRHRPRGAIKTSHMPPLRSRRQADNVTIVI